MKAKPAKKISMKAEVTNPPKGKARRLPPVNGSTASNPYVAVHLMFADDYQRSLKPQWAEKTMKSFNPKAFGLLNLSEREDGRYAVLDGHQRLNVLRQMGMTEAEAIVHHHLTVEEEAALFRLLNGITAMRAFDLWRAALIEKRPEALAVKALAKATGHEIPESHDGWASRTPGTSLVAVMALLSVYRREGPRTLESVLRISKRAWPEQAPSGHMIRALARVIHERGDGCALPEMLARFKDKAPTFASLQQQAHYVQGNERAEGKAMGGAGAYYAVFCRILFGGGKKMKKAA